MKLTGCTWDHPRGLDPLVATASAYRRSEVAWAARSLEAFGEASIADLAENHDLIVIDHPHVGAAARDGTLLPLDQWIDRETMRSLTDGAVGPSQTSYFWEGHQWALAIDAACQVSAFLPGALESPPVDWQQVAELAKGVGVVWPLTVADAFGSFCTILLALGATPAGEGGFVDEDVGVTALELMEEVARRVPDWCLEANPIAVLETLSRGEAIYCPLLYGYSNYARPRFREQIVYFANVPGGRGSILGGAGLAVSSKSNDPASAIAYAAWVASAEVQAGLYFSSGGQPASAAAWEDPTVNAACSNFFIDTRATIDDAWVRPPHPGFVGAHSRIGEEVRTFLRRPSQPEAAVERINEWYARSLQTKENP